MITLGYKTRFDSVTRAVAAIGIGLVMVFGGNAPTLVVKMLAVLLIGAGAASLIYGLVKNKETGVYHLLIANAVLDVIVGLLLFFNPQWIAGIIVYAIGILLILFGGLQLVALAGAMSLLEAGGSSLILSILAVVGGAFLLFNPFTINVMSVIAGCLLLLYGVSELISTFKMDKAKEEYEKGKIVISGDAKDVEYERLEEPEVIDSPDDLDDMN
ncbi:MAG: DUF308 domain-containing protein [Bacteroidales bacterium]|nr:DUF308 domain-containing protein [Bacteroidales bacterium]